MRIGIDAKWYFTGNISGRVVIVNLLQAIAKLPPKHTYVIILDAKDREKYFPYSDHPNFEIVYCKTYTNQLGNILSPFLLKKFKLDVCVYQYFSPFFSPFKRVIYIHDIIFRSNPEYFSKKERFYFKPMRTMARRAHGVVTVSITEEKRLLKYGYAGRDTRLISIHNGIGDKFHHLAELTDEERERVRKLYGLPAKFILYLGRITERKNVSSLIRAFAKIQDQQVKLVIAGEPAWVKTDIKEIIEQEHVTDRVKFTGFIADEDITTLYRLADVFCYLSFDEGFGLPVAEAMACGVSVVVSNTDIHKEICGDAATYADPYNISEIAGAIDEALKKSPGIIKRKEIGQLIVKNYTWENSANQLISFIEKI